jgi:hypothetical protein
VSIAETSTGMVLWGHTHHTTSPLGVFLLAKIEI